ncbi:S8 family serine peptidase [Halomicrobium salinisoli]|uniref:S8 family serine peptidase n=1 Tax=Halomicrobium salinisoli TaxID=2878391 RepID=UPI001CF07691|nr:S8 family serine peptidase [Halomicrobium salinisoli]
MGRRSVLQAIGSIGLALGGGVAAAETGRRSGREPGPRPDEMVCGVADGVDAEAVASTVTDVLPEAEDAVHANGTLGYVSVRMDEAVIERAAEAALAVLRSEGGGGPPAVAASEDRLPERAREMADSVDRRERDRMESVAETLREDPGEYERLKDLIAAAIESLPGVSYVEESVTYETQLVPNDPLFDEQYAPQLVNADDAWDVTLGSTDVTVAVVDSGIDYDHPDLDALFAADPGRDFADRDGDPDVDAGDEIHGTHVAGCAGADTNNEVGVAGPTDSRLLAARALDETGQGSLVDVADAVQWAADRGADVINLSLGGGSYTETMKRAVEYAYDENDALVVCAAGNAGASQVSYPARYEECVAVSALTPNEDLASFSNYGPNVELASPGVNVLSTVPGGDYRQLSGTSMAAPVASGVAALAAAANPELSAPELRQLLRETAVDVGLPENRQGAGRVDAANAVADGDGADNQTPTAAASADPTDPAVGETVTFDGSASSDPDGAIERYEWAFGDGSTATGVTVEHAYEEAGEFAATLTVTDGDGAAATDSVTVDVGPSGECAQTASGRATGSLSAWWDQDRWQWASRFESTCEATVSLSGPQYDDFDLYVTTDGREPTLNDYDARSAGSSSEESVTVSAVDGSLGILVDSDHGGGQYTLTVEERGSGERSAQEAALEPGGDDSDGLPGVGRGRSGESPGRGGPGEVPGRGRGGGGPGRSGGAPGKSGDAPGRSGDAPGRSGSAPGRSGNGSTDPEDDDGPIVELPWPLSR